MYAYEMSLAMVGTRASYEFRWRRWALLRDVVAAHLEGASTSRRYPVFASIGGAVGFVSVHVPAEALAAELREIRAQLAERPVTDLVLGPMTARVLYPRLSVQTARPLTHIELSQVAPIGDEKTLDHYFASMIDSMLEVCEHPTADGTIEIHDG